VKWASNFGLEGGKEGSSRLSLAGFLKDTNSVVVVRSWNTSTQGEISVLLFNELGGQVCSQPQGRSFTSSVPPFYADRYAAVTTHATRLGSRA
jgi:hypothetical protein